jgi:hypothetical protein
MATNTTSTDHNHLQRFISSSLAAVKTPAAKPRRATKPGCLVTVFWVDLLRHPRGCDVIRFDL